MQGLQGQLCTTCMQHLKLFVCGEEGRDVSSLCFFKMYLSSGGCCFPQAKKKQNIKCVPGSHVVTLRHIVTPSVICSLSQKQCGCSWSEKGRKHMWKAFSLARLWATSCNNKAKQDLSERCPAGKCVNNLSSTHCLWKIINVQGKVG